VFSGGERSDSHLAGTFALLVVLNFLGVVVAIRCLLWPGPLLDDALMGPPWWVGMLAGSVVGYPALLFHELGHALMAQRLLPDDEVKITLGSGFGVAQARMGRLEVNVKALTSPFGVAGVAEFDASRARAGDVALIALAGPAASTVALLAGLAALTVAPDIEVVRLALGVLTLFNTIGVLNLVPATYRLSRNEPKRHTDGRVVFDAARVLYELR